MKQITNLLKEGVINEHFPGCSYAVIYKDDKIDTDFVGYKQILPTKIKNNGTEIYDCASLTKVISTTTMTMKLIEENQLSLDTKISDVLPRFIHTGVTVFNILTHSTGLPADIPNATALRNKNDVEQKVYEFDLIYPTGKRIVYSDVGFILLGWMIEDITNQPLDVYAYETIFKPLNMIDTSYKPDTSRCAPTEYRDDTVYTGLLQGMVHDEKSFALSGVSGHAGMFSTVKDISKFIQSILRNDGVILKPKTVTMLFELRMEDISDKGTRLVRTLGWDKPTFGGTAGNNVSFENTIVHTGFTGCNVWIERELGIGFVMLSNAVHPKRSLNNIIRYRNRIGNIIVPPKEEKVC